MDAIETTQFQDALARRLQELGDHPFPKRYTRLFHQAVFMADYLHVPGLGLRALAKEGFRGLGDICQDA